jgi:hypothetical protein
MTASIRCAKPSKSGSNEHTMIPKWSGFKACSRVKRLRLHLAKNKEKLCAQAFYEAMM